MHYLKELNSVYNQLGVMIISLSKSSKNGQKFHYFSNSLCSVFISVCDLFYHFLTSVF